MEIQQLRYFIAVHKFRNFTRAAEYCNVAQPSLSQQIQTLETELGCPLFHRQGRKIILTESGEALLPRAEKILDEHKNAKDAVSDINRKGGRVNMGAILSIAPYLIPYLITNSSFWSRDFVVEENFTENLILKIKEGTLDFALMSSPIQESSLMVKTIALEPFVAVMPKNHKLRKKKKLTLNDILKEPFLELSNIHCAGKQQSEICSLTQSGLKTSIHSSQIETIKQLIIQGQGISILPRMSVDNSMDKEIFYFRELDEVDMKREITLVYHPDRYLSNTTRKWILELEKLTKQFIG